MPSFTEDILGGENRTFQNGDFRTLWPGPDTVTETAKILNYARMLRDSGLPLAKVAARLNADGYTTRNGRDLSPMTVWRLLNRG